MNETVVTGGTGIAETIKIMNEIKKRGNATMQRDTVLEPEARILASRVTTATRRADTLVRLDLMFI
jgi:hypothetical protein